MDIRSICALWGLKGAIVPLERDCSERLYYRVCGEKVLIMVASEKEVRQFSRVSGCLLSLGFSVPRVYAADCVNGYAVVEDFGERKLSTELKNITDYRETYIDLTRIIIRLSQAKPLMDLPMYTNAVLAKEAFLFIKYYCHGVLDKPQSEKRCKEFNHIWENYYRRRMSQTVITLRDFHVDNVMCLRNGGYGLLDFQDACWGSPMYDLVSLLEDARFDVPLYLQEEMKTLYIEHFSHWDAEAMLYDYDLLGLQRSVKILGIFSRMSQVKKVDSYLSHLPRIWHYIKRKLSVFPEFEEWLRKGELMYND